MNAPFKPARPFQAIVRTPHGLVYADCFATTLDRARQRIMDFENVAECNVLLIEERKM